MNRRSFLQSLGSGSLAGAGLMAGGIEGSSASSPKRSQRERRRRILFWDPARLDHWDNVEFVQGEPEWQPDASYIDPFEEGRRGGNFPVVWKDEVSGRWRMVYSVKWSPYTMMLADSEDGRRWEPLPVPRVEPPGGKLAPNHVHTIAGAGAGGVFVDPLAPDGFHFKVFARQHSEETYKRALADPKHEWHKLAKERGQRRYLTSGVTHVSRDGFHWSEKPDYAWDFPSWRPEPPLFLFRHQRQGRYGMTVRPGWGDRRVCIRYSDGADFTKWSDPELLFQPDALDTAAPIGLYGMPVFPCGDGYVGLLWVFHNSSSRPVNSFNQFFGKMDAQLAFSHDGVRFFRGQRKPFLKLNPFGKPGSAQWRPASLVETEREIRIYSEASMAPHGQERSLQRQMDEPLKSIELHTLRRDGYVSIRPRGDFGRIQTKPLALFQPDITINADARYGEVRAQLTNEKSEPLEGFSFEDCRPLRHVDSFDQKLEWKEAKVESVLGKLVRLEIELRNASLCSLTAAHHFLDAQDRWLLLDDRRIDVDRLDL